MLEIRHLLLRRFLRVLTFDVFFLRGYDKHFYDKRGVLVWYNTNLHFKHSILSFQRPAAERVSLRLIFNICMQSLPRIVTWLLLGFV